MMHKHRYSMHHEWRQEETRCRGKSYCLFIGVDKWREEDERKRKFSERRSPFLYFCLLVDQLTGTFRGKMTDREGGRGMTDKWRCRSTEIEEVPPVADDFATMADKTQIVGNNVYLNTLDSNF